MAEDTLTLETQPDYSIADLEAMVRGETPKPVEPAAKEPLATEIKVAPADTEEAKAKAEAPESDAVSETDDKQTPEQKANKKLERRFSSFSKQIKAATDRADALAAELEKAKAAPSPAKTPAVETKSATSEGRPTPPNMVDEDNFTGTFDELKAAKKQYEADKDKYYEDLSDWKVAQAISKKDAEAQQSIAQAKQNEVHGKWVDRVKTAIGVDPETADAVEEIGPVVTKAGISDVFKLSEVGPEMLLALYHDPNEAARIISLGNPILMAKELGKLETSLLARQPKPTETASRTNANLPKPVTTVGGKSAPVASIDLNTADQETFNREWKKSLARA